jgi:ubiquinone/menaquinone biosynthesis C-methylase UbiE
MAAEQQQSFVIESWRRKIEGIRQYPPIDYKLIFNEAVKNLAQHTYSLLDIGTGTGRVIFENGLNTIYGRVTGIDIRREMIDICRKHADGMRNVEFRVMDDRKMDFRDESFDVVTSMFSPNSPKEVYRVLTNGGYLIGLWGLKGDHKEFVGQFPEACALWDGESFEKLKQRKSRLEEAGFKVISSTVMKYKWIFKDEEVFKEFYQKICFAPIFEGKEGRLKNMRRQIDGSIHITRVIGTVVARKLIDRA